MVKIVSHVDAPQQLVNAVADYGNRTGMSKKAIVRWALAIWAEQQGYGHITVPVTVYSNPDGTSGVSKSSESFIEDGYPGA